MTRVLTATTEAGLRSFTEGLPNLVIEQGTAEVVTPIGVTLPARGVAGRWYALYSEFDEIELPAGVSAAVQREATEVCGIWFGG